MALCFNAVLFIGIFPHNRTVLSSDVDATKFPHELNLTLRTLPRWPLRHIIGLDRVLNVAFRGRSVATFSAKSFVSSSQLLTLN